jgi:CheY-like chemotaxis protein
VLKIPASSADLLYIEGKRNDFPNDREKPLERLVMIKVLVLAGNPETRQIFRMALETLGAPCDVAHSVSEMRQKLLRTPFNGVILDVLTTVRASQKEKLFIQEISELYPTLRVRWDSRTRRIRGLVLGRALDRDDPVGDFLEKHCRSWPARTCREDRRLPFHFNALLNRDGEFREEQAEKTVTLDLSEGGCFLISSRSWQKGEIARVRFLELSDPAPIRVEIRRCRPWGKGMEVPGIGVQFEGIRPGQLREIRRHLGGPRE